MHLQGQDAYTNAMAQMYQQQQGQGMGNMMGMQQVSVIVCTRVGNMMGSRACR